MEESIDISFIHRKWADRLLRICVVLSFLSVNANTPKTFEYVEAFKFITLAVDFLTGFVLTLEASFKICTCIKEKKPISKVRSLLFDCAMVVFIWLSLFVQYFLELSGVILSIDVTRFTSFLSIVLTASHHLFPTIAEIILSHKEINIPLGLIRIPRAFIMLRMLRYTNFQFESGRLTDIIVRAGHQIGGATLFLLFFLLLYGLLGVQLFGSLYHCIKNGSDPNNVSLSNLAVPDTHCSPEDYAMCPRDFECQSLNLSIQERGYGVFDNLIVSIKTVYEAASQEQWVFLMYENIDSYKDWHSYVYFITLVFFLAWLVKNVFIAVVIETFAEIRVQLHNVWGSSKHSHNVTNTQVISSSLDFSGTWTLIDISEEYRRTGTGLKERILEKWRKALRSRWYHMLMMVAIVLNVAITAFRPYGQPKGWTFFRIAELFFTLLFDIEAVVKIYCFGLKGYFKSSINKYEAFLAFMTTFNTIHSFHSALRSFPVFRIIRLVKLSPTLESFLYKIFGPAKKIGMLVTFTVGILILMSTISMQMLCYVDGLERFSTFPEAFMSMFQIMTQEGWIEVMQDAMKRVGHTSYIPISVYFILYHLFVTTVLISLFVAVILDNLELDENLKRFKQLKVNEQSVEMTRPFRLRIFEYFPNRPEMISLSKFHGEFALPRIRDSFLKQFCDIRSSPVHYSTLQHLTGLSTQAFPTFSPIFGVLASTSINFNVTVSLKDYVIRVWSQVVGQLAFQQDEKFNLTKLNQIVRHSPTDGNENEYRRRLKWRRSKDAKTSDTQDDTHPMSRYFAKPFSASVLSEDCQRQTKNTKSVFANVLPSQNHPLLRTQNLKQQEIRTLNMKRRTFANLKLPVENNIESSEKLFNDKVHHEVDFKLIHLKRQQALLKKQRQEQELRENHPLFDTPLLIIKRDSKFRKFCKTVVTAQYDKHEEKSDIRKQEHVLHFLHDLLGLVPYLDWIMILITIASCTSMLMETNKHRIHEVFSLQITEYLFAFSMGFELLMKVFANGLYFTPNPTFEGLGALLDLTTFIVSFLFVCSLRRTDHGSQVLLVLRCLRPLRIFKLVPQMKQVVVELLRSLKEIVMVGILLVALMFVFAIFGVQVYGGKLASCNDFNKTQEQCVGIFYQKVWLSNRLQLDNSERLGFWVPRVWTNPRNFNFDTMGDAMLTLFEVLSLKGWTEVRDVIVEKMGLIGGIYIHLFVFLGCMMGLTLFIGVVIANYNENRGTALLTVDQRRWEDLKSRMKITQPLHSPKRPTGSKTRIRMFDLAENSWFKIVLACCVMFRVLLLSVKWNFESYYAKYLVWTSIGLCTIFWLEIVVKILGMTFSGMVCSYRNLFDLFLSTLDFFWVLLYFVDPDGFRSYVFHAGWMLAALRFFSICGKHATLKMLFMTVVVSVSHSFFIIAAMILLLLCYAYAGVALFGNVKYGENIGRHANFASAPLAVTVLFRIITGEDWNRIMHDCMVQPPQCTPSDKFWESDCGNVSAALIYFCSFYVIIAYIMLNLLVAIIVENFSLFYTMDADILFGYNDLHMFQVAWNEIDVKRKGIIPVYQVEELLCKLTGRLAVDPVQDRVLLKHISNEMLRIGRLSTAGNRNNSTGQQGNGGIKKSDEELYVTFHDVMLMMAYRSVDIRKSLQLEELLMRVKLETEIEEEVAMQMIMTWMRKHIVLRRHREKERVRTEKKADQPTDIAATQINSLLPGCTSAFLTNPSENESRVSGETAGELPEKEYADVMKRGKHRRQGLWKAKHPGGRLGGANPFGSRLPAVMVEGMNYKDDLAKKSDHSSTTVAGHVLSTSVDGWWENLSQESN